MEMATSVYYSGIGKSLIVNGDTFFTFYGKDNNPNKPARPSPRTPSTTYASGETSYNLSGFQPNNEVCCCLLMFKNGGSSSINLSFGFDFQKSGDGISYYSTGWEETTSASISSNSIRMWYFVVGIDNDEIWIGETYYRFHITWSSTDGSSGTFNVPFTVSNLSFDDSRHDAGYFWVEGDYLCYIDGTWTDRGYKHKIGYDTGYNGGSGSPGYIWIPSNSTSYIYYVAADGTVRRTHSSNSRPGYYAGNYRPSGAIPGSIWVSRGDPSNYGYLCYIRGDGAARRICNGEP